MMLIGKTDCSFSLGLRAFMLLTVACFTLGNAWASDGKDARVGEPPKLDSKKAARHERPVVLSPTWYKPAQMEEGKKYPLAVILASSDFPTGNDGYWVPELWRQNYCTLVITSKVDRTAGRTSRKDRSWENVSVGMILKQMKTCPTVVPADMNRLLVVSDNTTGPLAIRMMDGLADRIVGSVMISVAPVELTGRGFVLWQPRPAVWKIPIWSVVGTRAKDAARLLEMWRAIASTAPAKASLTIDTRIGRGLGHNMPDKAISNWLASIAAGNRPAKGPDRQAENERKTFAPVAQQLRVEMKQDAKALPAGEMIDKKEGPFESTVVLPRGWQRVPKAERAYNPNGRPLNPNAKTQSAGLNPYSEIYVTPKVCGPFFGRVCAVNAEPSGGRLIDNFDRRLARKGYLSVPLSRWQDGIWEYQISSILMPWNGKWHRWLTLLAGKTVGKNYHAAPLIFLMDASGKPNPQEMAAAMKRLTQSTNVKRTRPISPVARPKPL